VKEMSSSVLSVLIVILIVGWLLMLSLGVFGVLVSFPAASLVVLTARALKAVVWGTE
jgi:hypothetical protein